MHGPLDAGFAAGKETLRQLHRDDDAEHDGDGRLGGAEAAGERRRELAGH